MMDLQGEMLVNDAVIEQWEGENITIGLSCPLQLNYS
jgi:hypothetical protein